MNINENGIIEGRIPGVRDNKVYNDAISKDIESYVLYIKNEDDSNEKIAYKDQACTEMVSCDEMRDMFVKGVIVISADGHAMGGNMKIVEYAKAETFRLMMPLDETLGDIACGVLNLFLMGSSIDAYSKEFVELNK